MPCIRGHGVKHVLVALETANNPEQFRRTVHSVNVNFVPGPRHGALDFVLAEAILAKRDG